LKAAEDIITNVRNKKYVSQARAALKLAWNRQCGSIVDVGKEELQ
jgi:hypothetical protein